MQATVTSGGAWLTAYLGSFDPSNGLTNYVGGAGVQVAPATPVTFAFSVPNGAAYVIVVEEVISNTGAAYSLDITSAPLAVSFRSLSASATSRGTLLRWRTASELDLLGFNVYRQLHGQRVRVNARLIRAHGAGAYSFLDRMAPRARAARYWIQAVNLDGSRSWYGPARAARTQSSPRRLAARLVG